MFHFSGFATRPCGRGRPDFNRDGFPHSDTSGSKPARRLPEDYRSLATSFIASLSQGIHHTPLFFSRKVTIRDFLLGNLHTFYLPNCQCSGQTGNKNPLFRKRRQSSASKNRAMFSASKILIFLHYSYWYFKLYTPPKESQPRPNDRDGAYHRSPA